MSFVQTHIAELVEVAREAWSIEPGQSFERRLERIALAVGEAVLRPVRTRLQKALGGDDAEDVLVLVEHLEEDLGVEYDQRVELHERLAQAAAAMEMVLHAAPHCIVLRHGDSVCGKIGMHDTPSGIICDHHLGEFRGGSILLLRGHEPSVELDTAPGHRALLSALRQARLVLSDAKAEVKAEVKDEEPEPPAQQHEGEIWRETAAGLAETAGRMHALEQRLVALYEHSDRMSRLEEVRVSAQAYFYAADTISKLRAEERLRKALLEAAVMVAPGQCWRERIGSPTPRKVYVTHVEGGQVVTSCGGSYPGAIFLQFWKRHFFAPHQCLPPQCHVCGRVP